MSGNFYETDRALAEYLLLHYGNAQEVLPYHFGPAEALHFPIRCVRECLDLARPGPAARALDIGCAVGGATFELARFCHRVIGIDFSDNFIKAARHLQQHGFYDFSCIEEGDLTLQATARVPPEIDRGRVSFQQGDAQQLPADLGQFDVVIMANLMDRLAEPRRCLERLPALLNPGGQLILTSPYSWLPEFTPRQNWLGGYVRDGKPVRALDTLREILEPNFTLNSCKDLPLLIREHARKFQWVVSQASVWIRK